MGHWAVGGLLLQLATLVTKLVWNLLQIATLVWNLLQLATLGKGAQKKTGKSLVFCQTGGGRGLGW